MGKMMSFVINYWHRKLVKKKATKDFGTGSICFFLLCVYLYSIIIVMLSLSNIMFPACFFFHVLLHLSPFFFSLKNFLIPSFFLLIIIFYKYQFMSLSAINQKYRVQILHTIQGIVITLEVSSDDRQNSFSEFTLIL